MKLADTYSKISVEKAQRVHGQNEKSCQYFSLVTRSKVQIVKEEFEEAFKSLLTAYKLNIKSDHDPTLKNNLKMVVVLVKARENISSAKVDVLHKHFEDIGDALCKYIEDPFKLIGIPEKKRVLGLSVKYYRKAMEAATNSGAVETIPDLNNSIAQTYMEMEDFHHAEELFKKQLEYETGLPEAACQTYSNIASVQESLGRGFTTVLGTMKSWLQLAEKNNIETQVKFALQEIVSMHERLGKLEDAKDYVNRVKCFDDGDIDPSSSDLGVDTQDNFPYIDIDKCPR